MPIDNIDPLFHESTGATVHPELLLSAVLHLMSHYTSNLDETGTCIKLASVIERHLKALADLPTLAPVLQATCQQLAEQWTTVVERAMSKPAKYNMFKRLINGRES